jgi:thiamine biosynthesis lipoprotein
MNAPDRTPFRHEFGAMTTRCELLFHGVDDAAGAELARRIEARVAGLVRRYNFHAPDSWLSVAVNGRRGDRVPLDEEGLAVLRQVREHAHRCAGAFDITVGTYAEPLARARTQEEVDAVYRSLAPCTGLQAWSLEGDALRLHDPRVRIDLGGVIKEHAVDVSARMAQAAGVGAGLVNYGGDLRTFGRKPDGSRFVAAVPDPRPPHRMLFALDLEDQALTTSGHYARRRALQGGVLSHVRAADASRARWASVSVVSDSTLVSGIYSTALLVDAEVPLPPCALAIAIDADGRIHHLEPRAAAASTHPGEIAPCTTSDTP